jgi:hypothetical protein
VLGTLSLRPRRLRPRPASVTSAGRTRSLSSFQRPHSSMKTCTIALLSLSYLVAAVPLRRQTVLSSVDVEAIVALIPDLGVHAPLTPTGAPRPSPFSRLRVLMSVNVRPRRLLRPRPRHRRAEHQRAVHVPARPRRLHRRAPPSPSLLRSL